MENMLYHRSRLMEYMMLEYGLYAWTEYWNTVRLFITGAKGKQELDYIVKKYLVQDRNNCVYMHNNLILSILNVADLFEQLDDVTSPTATIDSSLETSLFQSHTESKS